MSHGLLSFGADKLEVSDAAPRTSGVPPVPEVSEDSALTHTGNHPVVTQVNLGEGGDKHQIKNLVPLPQVLASISEKYHNWPQVGKGGQWLPQEEWHEDMRVIVSQIKSALDQWSRGVETEFYTLHPTLRPRHYRGPVMTREQALEMLASRPNQVETEPVTKEPDTVVGLFLRDFQHVMVNHVINQLDNVSQITPINMGRAPGSPKYLSLEEGRQTIQRGVAEVFMRMNRFASHYQRFYENGLLSTGHNNVMGLIAQSLSPAKTLAREKNLKFDVDVNGFVQHVMNSGRFPLTPYGLFTIIANLADNAVKYTDKGRVKVYVGPPRHLSSFWGGPKNKKSPGYYLGSRAVPSLSEIVIRVTDSGRGFPMSQKDSILANGGRGANVGEVVGTGYGVKRVENILEHLRTGVSGGPAGDTHLKEARMTIKSPYYSWGFRRRGTDITVHIPLLPSKDIGAKLDVAASL